MAGEPLISIVTPSYNQGKFIEQTIQSVLNQTYKRVELLVMDGGSTDDTLSILQRFSRDPRFRFVSEKDQGQSDAINKGLERSTGEVFNWLNSDDYLEAGALEKVADAFANGATIFSGRLRKFGEPGEQTTGYYELEIEKNPEATLVLGRYCQPSTFWRTDLFRQMGGVSNDLHCAMDFHLWAKYLASHGLEGVKKTREILAHYREHPGSKSALLNKSFKDEISGVFLDLLHAVDAPELLRQAVRQRTTKAFVTHWTIGPHFDRARFVALFSHQLSRQFYYQGAYDRARELLKISFDAGATWDAWRLKSKLLFKPRG